MGFFESVFGGKDEVKFKEAPQSKSAAAAIQKQDDILAGGAPVLPTRQIAGLAPLSEERNLARSTAKDLLTPREDVELMDRADIQAIIKRSTDEGNLIANRLGRGLQNTGSFTSTTGRDVIGRLVSDIESNLVAELAPFAEGQRNRAVAERQRIQNLIPQLESLGAVREAETRMTKQAELDAIFEQAFGTSQQTQQFLLPLLNQIITNQPQQVSTIQAGRPGLLDQIGAVAGATGKVGGAISGFGGGGGSPPPSRQTLSDSISVN